MAADHRATPSPVIARGRPRLCPNTPPPSRASASSVEPSRLVSGRLPRGDQVHEAEDRRAAVAQVRGDGSPFTVAMIGLFILVPTDLIEAQDRSVGEAVVQVFGAPHGRVAQVP